MSGSKGEDTVAPEPSVEVSGHFLGSGRREQRANIDGMDPSSCTPARVSVMMRVADIITPFAGGFTMAQITTLGIDTAKQVFQLHGVDTHGNVVLHKRITRKQVLPLLAQLPPCLVGLEACGGSHYWAREITKLGHTVKLMAPQAVKPYVHSIGIFIFCAGSVSSYRVSGRGCPVHTGEEWTVRRCRGTTTVPSQSSPPQAVDADAGSTRTGLECLSANLCRSLGGVSTYPSALSDSLLRRSSGEVSLDS